MPEHETALTAEERRSVAASIHESLRSNHDGWPAVYAAVGAIVARRERKAAEGALREAADLLQPYSGIGMGMQPTRSDVSDWLRDRADAIAAGDQP